MTILGEHTVHELNDLVTALSYEVSQTMKANIACVSWAQRDPKAFADWNTKLVQVMAGWSTAVHVAMVRIGETPQASGTPTRLQPVDPTRGAYAAS